MTAGELLEACRLFSRSIPCLRCSEAGRLSSSRHTQTMRAFACGGLIAEACKQGLAIGRSSLSVTGAGSHPKSKAYPPERLRSPREDEEARQAGAELGLNPGEMLFLGLSPDRFVPHGR